VPEQPAPVNVHVTPLFWGSFATVAVKVVVCVVCTEAVDLFRVTATAAAVALIVTCAEALLLVCAWETAVTVTVAGEGTVAGAVYIPAGSIVPCVESPPVTPFTCHVTVVLDVFDTVAVNGLLVATCTVTLVGVTDTVMLAGGGVSVDFTFAHPHTAKAASRNAAFAEKYDKKLRFCDVRRKFINSYPPGILIASLTEMLFVFLFKRTRQVFRTAAGSSNRRVQGLTFYKNRRKAHASKYWKEPSSQVPPGHNLRTKVRIR
jgi:hypothetical protein